MVIGAAALAVASVAAAGDAYAAQNGDDDCYKVTYKDPKTGEIKIKIVCPGTPGGGGENTGGGIVKCFYLGNEVPGEPGCAVERYSQLLGDPRGSAGPATGGQGR